MMNNQRSHWGAMIVVAGMLAGCGGGSGGGADETAQSSTTTTVQPSGISGSAEKPLLPEEYDRHDMAGFISFWNQSYATTAMKMLISAIGPKKLLDHLESFKTNSQNPEERSVADKFTEIIHKTYASGSAVWTDDFIKGLQNLAPFNKRNAAGEWEFALDKDIFSGEKDPEKFLLLFSELFRLDTLPGWSFDVNETYVHQGQERAHQRAKNPFQMFQPVDLDRVKPEDVSTLNLQKIVDLLHADQDAQVQWNADDAELTAVKVIRQVSIADVENFKRLTISLQGGLPREVIFSLNDTVTLPAINQKTRQKIVLTLTGQEAITWDNLGYAIRIKNHHGQWMEHDESLVFPADLDDVKDRIKVINFSVTNIAPAP